MAIRSRNIYNPEGEKPFKLSRTKVDNYINCKRCFYIDRRLGVGQPPGFPFNINSAVDELLKKEFFLGNVKLKAHDLCRPCKYLQESLNQNNIIKEFLQTGGLRCEILSNGKIFVDDIIRTYD